jgi:hypothetical protein
MSKNNAKQHRWISGSPHGGCMHHYYYDTRLSPTLGKQTTPFHESIRFAKHHDPSLPNAGTGLTRINGNAE